MFAIQFSLKQSKKKLIIIAAICTVLAAICVTATVKILEKPRNKAQSNKSGEYSLVVKDNDFRAFFKQLGIDSESTPESEQSVRIPDEFDEVYNESLKWAEKHDSELVEMLSDKEYSLKVLGIERGNAKPRKDIAKWSDVKENIIYMYDDKFLNSNQEYPYQVISDKESINKILELYIEKYYDENDDKQTWLDKIKDLAGEMGYAREVKEFKANPDSYKAHVGDVSTVLRVALTGRTNTPDMYEIMQVLGKTSVENRLRKAMEN